MEEVSTTSPSTTINNPINNDPPKVAIKINATTPQYFIKMEYVLNFLKNKIIPNIKSSPPVPLVDIITNRTSNIMYCIGDIHISLDPRVCIVRNDGFRELDTPSGILVSKAYPELDEWRDSSNKNKAYLNNIYLNFSFVISCLESSQDEKGNSNLFQFLKALCDGLNKALGGVNNLEPTINENKNQIRIIDTTPIPNSTPSSTMEDFVLFGYDGAKSNFVRKLDIKTAVPPEMATMISVGVTSGGYVKGVEATAFAKWNKGIEDRFKVEFIPPNVSSSIDAHDEVIENYKENFVQNDAGAYGLDAIAEPRTFTDSVITKNLSTVTEYYRYIFSTFKNSGGAVGFIPFKLNFTIDGISGFKIYNKVLANLKFLSKDYQNFLNFIVTEINHKVSNHDWETELSCVLHPNTEKISPKIVKSKQIVNAARTPPTPVAVYGTGTPTNYTGEGWEPLITLITTGESKTGGYDALNPSTTFTAQHGKPFNQLTIQEAIDLAKKTREIKKATSRTPSLVTGAMGLYQQMPNPLPERVIRAGLSLSNLFDKAAQDKIAIEYNIKEKRPNLRKYCMGENAGNQDDLEKAIQAYGQEWASAPVCWTGLSVGSGTRIGDPNQLGSLGKGKFNQTGCYPRQKDSAYPVSDVVKVFMKVRKNLGGSKPTFIPSYINWDSL